MARDPTDEDVVQFCDFAGLDARQDHSMVASALKSNYNMEQLLAEYYDDPSIFRKKYAWDETVFAADREGATNSTGISFNIDSPDNAVIQGVTPPPDVFYGPSAGAPSRPPSRTNNRSPLGRLIDWNAGDASGVPNNAAQEEEDLQRALRESAAESGFTPQEAGITDTTSQATFFGPANRDEYDQNDWAMVRVGASISNKTETDPPPSARKREPGAPAFLVQQPNTRNSPHRLGALLTMLHEIPLVRNVLLQTGTQAPTYGHNTEWWKGQPIYPPHVLAAMQQGELQWAAEAKPDFNEEIHRVMAFLDSTERSYGSIESLADLVQSHSIDIERQFYEILTDCNPIETFESIVQKASSKSVQTFGDSSEPVQFGILDLELSKQQYESITTLYEACDAILWNDALTWNEVGPDTKMAVLHDPGEVMVVMLGGDGPAESIEVPDVWYLERYLESRQEEARAIQEHLAWAAKALYQGESLEYEYTKWVHPQTHKVHDKRDMLKKTINEYERHAKYLDGLARFRELQRSGFDEQRYPDLEDVPCIMTDQEEDLTKNCEHMVQRCKFLLAQIEEKMQKLNWERERIRERQRYLGRILTDPNKPGQSKPFASKRFLLRGVATARDIVYVCRRAEPQLIELESEPEPSDQWWRLAYVAEETEPVKAEKVNIELVMRQMFQESKKPILVYATEDALTVTPAPLSDSLQRFIRAENKNFRQELNQENTNEGGYKRSTNVSPISPSKRKYRSGSVDSMATNRASLGNSDTNSRAGDFDMEPFFDGDGGAVTELAEMSHRRSPSEGQTQSLAQMVHSQGTPETVRSYDLDSPVFGRGEAPMTSSYTEVSRTVTPDLDDQARGPEMQERGGSTSPFVTRIASNTETEAKPLIDLMDMEIPLEHQD